MCSPSVAKHLPDVSEEVEKVSDDTIHLITMWTKGCTHIIRDWFNFSSQMDPLRIDNVVTTKQTTTKRYRYNLSIRFFVATLPVILDQGQIIYIITK